MEKPEGERKFGRRRPPSRQATRLMLVSALAAIGLGAVLGALFLPTLLKFESRPLYTFDGRAEGARENVTVVRATNPRPFGELGFVLFEDGMPHQGSLRPDIPVGPVSAVDATRDGHLNVGDYLLVQVEPGRDYLLQITLNDDPLPGGVGVHEWSTKTPRMPVSTR